MLQDGGNMKNDKHAWDDVLVEKISRVLIVVEDNSWVWAEVKSNLKGTKTSDICLNGFSSFAWTFVQCDHISDGDNFGQGDNHQLSISVYEPLRGVGKKARHMWHVEEGAKKGKPGLDQDGV